MKVYEITEASRIAFKKSGNPTGRGKGSHVTRKYRCTSGPRKGQVRASPAACNAPINYRKSVKLSQTKQRVGSKAKVKSALTKKYNPVSKMVRRVNKPLTPKRRKKMR